MAQAIKEMDEILHIVGEEHITGYQMRDIFDENKKINVVKRKIKNKVAQNNMIYKGIIKDEAPEGNDLKDEIEEKSIDYP